MKNLSWMRMTVGNDRLLLEAVGWTKSDECRRADTRTMCWLNGNRRTPNSREQHKCSSNTQNPGSCLSNNGWGGCLGLVILYFCFQCCSGVRSVNFWRRDKNISRCRTRPASKSSQRAGQSFASAFLRLQSASRSGNPRISSRFFLWTRSTDSNCWCRTYPTRNPTWSDRHSDCPNIPWRWRWYPGKNTGALIMQSLFWEVQHFP